MKKLFTVLGIFISLFLFYTANAVAADILIPDYKCIINNCDIYYRDSIYPFISYKDITYFPMTWDYSKALNISSSWVEGKGLYIAYHPSYADLPIYETTVNKKYDTAVIPTYPIYINGSKIENESEEWPILNYRGITYFPMTWHYAHDEFNWTVNWDGNFSLDPYITDSPGDITVIYEIGDESASLYKYRSFYTVEDPNNDGNQVSYVYSGSSEEFFSFNYDTGSLTPINFEHEDFYKWRYDKNHKDTSEVTFKDGRILYEGELLAEIKALSDGIDEDELTAYVSCSLYNGAEVYDFTVYTSRSVPAPYTPFESFVYIKKDGKFIFIDDNAVSSGGVKMPDGNIYVNTHKYSGYRHSSFHASRLYRLDNENNLTFINNEYPDYNSMKIIGASKNTLHLKCEWSENEAPYGEYDISPANDGYFTLDNNAIFTKKALWREVYDEFVSPDGRLFIITNPYGEIKRLY